MEKRVGGEFPKSWKKAFRERDSDINKKKFKKIKKTQQKKKKGGILRRGGGRDFQQERLRGSIEKKRFGENVRKGNRAKRVEKKARKRESWVEKQEKRGK